jgi:hypothetical protein
MKMGMDIMKCKVSPIQESNISLLNHQPNFWKRNLINLNSHKMSKNLFLSILALSAFSCTNKTNCKHTACTELFAMVMVEVSDTANTTLKGVSTQTVLLSTGATIHNEAEAASYPVNSFTVVDDSDLKTLGYNGHHQLELRVLKDGKVLKSFPYSIDTDCCHVSKAEGPEKVSLN